MYHSLLVQLKNCQIISFMKEFMYSCMEGQNDSMDQSKLQQYYDKIMDQNLNDDDCNPGCDFETHCLLLSIFLQETLPETIMMDDAILELKPVHTLRRILLKYARVFETFKMNDFMYKYLRNQQSICEAMGWKPAPSDKKESLRAYRTEVQRLVCNHLERTILLSIFVQTERCTTKQNHQLILKPTGQLREIFKQISDCDTSLQELSEDSRKLLQKWNMMLPLPRFVRHGMNSHQSLRLLADDGEQDDFKDENGEECPDPDVENDFFDEIETGINIDRSQASEEIMKETSTAPAMSTSIILEKGAVKDLFKKRQRLKAVTKDPLRDIIAKASTANAKKASNQPIDAPTISEHLLKMRIHDCLQKIKDDDISMTEYKLSKDSLNRILLDEEIYSKFEKVLSDVWYKMDNTMDTESDAFNTERNLEEKYILAIQKKSNIIRSIIEGYQNKHFDNSSANHDERVEDNRPIPMPNMYKKQPSAKQLKFSPQESSHQPEVDEGSVCESIDEPCTPPMYKKPKSAQQLKFYSQSLDFDESDEDSENIEPYISRRRKFSGEEKEAIVQGVKKHGVGKWQLIKSSFYKILKGRSSQNLKVRETYDLQFFRSSPHSV